MRELFGLESFRRMLLNLFFLGLSFGVIFGIYLFSPETFRFYFLIPIIPVLFLISRGLYSNVPLFMVDLKSITK